MLLAVDIGNTNITLGSYEGDKLCFVSRMSTDVLRTSDQYAIELKSILALYEILPENIKGAIISSVVPPLTKGVGGAITKITGIVPLILGPGVKTGLNIKIDNPAQLGADLVAGAVAAVHLYPLPCILFDLGTATTISVIDKYANFLGGVIAAGVGISLDALTSRTAALPDVSLEAPPSVIGTNTIDSMKSGLVLGASAMVDGLTDRILEKLGSGDATLVATGGLAREIIKHCRHTIVYSDNLILEGLKVIYNKNQK